VRKVKTTELNGPELSPRDILVKAINSNFMKTK